MIAPSARGATRKHALAVFTKPARPGEVKTRLIPALGAQRAALLHQAFLDDLLATLAEAAFAVEIGWALRPDEPVPPAGRPGFAQHGAGLGERLHDALARLLAVPGRRAAAVVGSDLPELPLAAVDAAFAWLGAGADLVLGPSADGGYYLVALRAGALDARLFAGIAWSTDTVLDETLARAAGLGLRVELLARGEDVDTPADLARLCRRLAAAPGSCPRTRRRLAAWGMLPAAAEQSPPSPQPAVEVTP